jgi:hypothetical protein
LSPWARPTSRARCHIACRRGYPVLALGADELLKTLKHARLPQTHEMELRKVTYGVSRPRDDRTTRTRHGAPKIERAAAKEGSSAPSGFGTSRRRALPIYYCAYNARSVLPGPGERQLWAGSGAQ